MSPKRAPAAPAPAKPKVTIVRMRAGDLLPADYNPRRIDPAALAGLRKSVERFGLVQPVVQNARTGNVVGGHQRLKVIDPNDVIDVFQIDVPLNEEKALNIALNSEKISGEFTGQLEGLLAELRAGDATLFSDLRLDAFTDADLAKLVDSPEMDDLWAGMPGFEHKDAAAFKSITVHFYDQAGVDQFARVLGVEDRIQNRYLWYPEMIIDHVDHLAFKSEVE